MIPAAVERVTRCCSCLRLSVRALYVTLTHCRGHAAWADSGALHSYYVQANTT